MPPILKDILSPQLPDEDDAGLPGMGTYTSIRQDVESFEPANIELVLHCGTWLKNATPVYRIEA